jgi:hypothetical protein
MIKLTNVTSPWDAEIIATSASPISNLLVYSEYIRNQKAKCLDLSGGKRKLRMTPHGFVPLALTARIGYSGTISLRCGS